MSTLVGQAAAAAPAVVAPPVAAPTAATPIAPTVNAPPQATSPRNLAPTQPKPDVGKDLERGATQLAGALGSGFRAASRSLAESSPGALEALLPGALSPALVSADPLLALSTRLAAESDFWRRLGLQSLSRSIVADRVSYVVTALGVLSGLGLTIVAGLGGLFGGEHAVGKSALLGAGALIVLCAGAIAFTFTHVIRRGQRNAANAAFARAERAEQRLERVAIAAALREREPDAFRAALLRITEDLRS